MARFSTRHVILLFLLLRFFHESCFFRIPSFERYFVFVFSISLSIGLPAFDSFVIYFLFYCFIIHFPILLFLNFISLFTPIVICLISLPFFLSLPSFSSTFCRTLDSAYHWSWTHSSHSGCASQPKIRVMISGCERDRPTCWYVCYPSSHKNLGSGSNYLPFFAF